CAGCLARWSVLVAIAGLLDLVTGGAVAIGSTVAVVVLLFGTVAISLVKANRAGSAVDQS
ncbi:MAG: hypothetical protein R2723_12580, partial [Microbacterium sp.]